MDVLYNLLVFLHVISFVFMSTPLFNLIVVNERLSFGSKFNYDVDRYMENIIKNGAGRCFVFQSTVVVSGVLLLILGPMGIASLWTNWVLLTKTILLFVLVQMLANVHFSIQPKIESIFAKLNSSSGIPDDLAAELKPLRIKRKKMATFCLFLVLVIIILGLQVYDTFGPILTAVMIVLAGLFALKANKTLIKFGWI